MSDYGTLRVCVVFRFLSPRLRCHRLQNMKTSNALIQQLLRAEEEAEQIVHKARESELL